MFFFCNGNNYITVPLQPKHRLFYVIFIVYVFVCVCVVWDYSTGRVGAPLVCCEIQLKDWIEGECDTRTHTHLSALIKTLSRTFTYPSDDTSGGLLPRENDEQYNSRTKEKEVEKSIYGQLRPCKEDTSSCYFPDRSAQFCSINVTKRFYLEMH